MGEKDKIKTSEIEVRVASYFDYRKNIIVPNISWGVNIHECDLLIVRKSGYGIEVEIKVNKYDLIADAKKEHNHNDRMDRISELYFAMPGYMKDCIEYVPERAGILLLSRCSGRGLELIRFRDAVINKNRNKFSEEEMLKIAHLGTMRIWNLKRTINSYHLKLRKKKIKDQHPVLF